MAVTFSSCAWPWAYSPYGRVTWERQWQEGHTNELAKKGRAITRELEAAAPTIASLCEEAEKQAQVERQRWEAQCRERERQERERRRAEAIKYSRAQLLEIVEAWSLARNIEGFFEDAERRALIWSPTSVGRCKTG